MRATAGGGRTCGRRPRRDVTLLALVVALGLAVAAATAGAASVPAATIGTTQTVPSASSLSDIACPTSSTCYAVGIGTDDSGDVDGVVVPIVDGVPGAPVPVPGGGDTELSLSAIACPTSSTCYAVGAELAPVAASDSGAEVVTHPDGNPSAALPAAPSSADEIYASFDDIACTSNSACVAVGQETTGDGADSDGATDLISGGSPATLQDDPAVASLTGVYCSGASCQAAGSQTDSDETTTAGAIVALGAGAAPGAPQTLSAIAGLGMGVCPSAGSCLLLGETGVDAADEVLVPETGTSPGAPVAAPDLLALACASSVSCLGVGTTDDGYGAVTEIANGIPGSLVTDSDSDVDGLQAAACPSATSCLAVGVGDDDAEGVVVPVTLPTIGAATTGGSGTGTTTTTTKKGSGGKKKGSGSGRKGSGSGKKTSGGPDLTFGRVHAKGTQVSLRLSCAASARCAGTITETVARTRQVGARRVSATVTVARARYSLPAGRHVTRTLTLDAAGRRALAASAADRLTVRVVVALHTGAHAGRTVTLHGTARR